MTTTRSVLTAAIALTLLTACGDDATDAPPEAAPAADGAPARADASKKEYDEAEAGLITGTVSFAGTVPEPKFQKMIGDAWCIAQWPDGGFLLENLVVTDGRVRDVFVWIKSGLDGDYDFPPPDEPVILGNENCMYEPRVVGVQVGQALRATNEDKVMHNVHTKPKLNREKNTAIPFPDTLGYRDFDFRRPETMIEVVCDVHPWMKGWIGVTDHPFFAVTNANGEFSIPGVPAGTYTVGVWQEQLGEREFTVTVEARGEARHQLSY